MPDRRRAGLAAVVWLLVAAWINGAAFRCWEGIFSRFARFQPRLAVAAHRTHLGPTSRSCIGRGGCARGSKGSQALTKSWRLPEPQRGAVTAGGGLGAHESSSSGSQGCRWRRRTDQWRSSSSRRRYEELFSDHVPVAVSQLAEGASRSQRIATVHEQPDPDPGPPADRSADCQVKQASVRQCATAWRQDASGRWPGKWLFSPQAPSTSGVLDARQPTPLRRGQASLRSRPNGRRIDRRGHGPTESGWFASPLAGEVKPP